MRAVIDEALGEHRDEPTAVQILSYSGKGVPSTIGTKFQELTGAMGLAARDCPIVSATRRAGANALGHPQDSGIRDLSYRLAVAVSDFHFSFELGGRKEALVAIRRIMLELGGRMGGKTYHQHLIDADVTPDTWRPEALTLAQALRFRRRRPFQEVTEERVMRAVSPNSRRDQLS
jgi:hypothetical protein